MNEDIFLLDPYALKKEEKNALMVAGLCELTHLHQEHCQAYANILESFGYANKNYGCIEDFFALPVRIFKEIDLLSSKEIVKTLTSSGTTGKVSTIYLDKLTAQLQTKALIKIMQSFLGKARLPMLIIDTKEILQDRNHFSARAAGVMGLSNFGRKHTYVLDASMQLDIGMLKDFLSKYKDQPILIFGFTYMVWEYFFKPINENKIDIDLSNAILFHSGGWKKLEHLKVSNALFKESFQKVCNLRRIHNFYGMVEQVGSIFVECEAGHLHTPNFADIIIRDPLSLEPLGMHQEGLIELCSLLPHSYPGHVLLSEDRGVILGEDDCACGRKGKYFSVLGRIKSAEKRGCSDTFIK